MVYKGGCATENDNGPPKIGSKNDVELKGCHDYCQRTDTCQFYEYNTGMLARLGQANQSSITNPQNLPISYMNRLDTKKSNIKGHNHRHLGLVSLLL